jgi:hypothetical protein
MQGQSRRVRSPRKIERFLNALREGRTVSAAAADAGVSFRLVYYWRAKDADFAKAWQEALEEGTDRLEDEARRRAVEGTTKPIYQRGERVGEVQVYSDALLMFLLKGRRPDKYRERLEHTGKDGAPLETHTVSDEELAKAILVNLAKGIRSAPGQE